jgi:multidrug efflux pump subunit AcrB
MSGRHPSRDPLAVHRRDLIGIFAHHRVAANLLMLLMLLAGALALERLNVQFFPRFALDVVTVRVAWTGASAEDVEDGITQPLEQRLRTVDGLHRLTSTSAQGVASITLEFVEGTDPLLALDQVRRFVDEFRNFPADAEKPEVALATRYETVARVLLTGVADPGERRALARRFETELLDAGVDRVDLVGLPLELIAIQVDQARLTELGLGLDAIGDRVAAWSRDLPAGVAGREEGGRELRSLDQARDPLAFARLPVLTQGETRIDLGDVATIERAPRDDQTWLSLEGATAVELLVQRTEQGDSLAAARVLEGWLERTRPQLPPGVGLVVYDESWQLIAERILLLVKNGLGGLVLVVAILYLFLTGRVAFWVAAGIPTAFMATLFILWLAGGTINMISLFALIMALGIIVDDAIVVGESALAHYQSGEPALLAAEGGARRMIGPVMASSLTTVAAFMPLLLVGGVFGAIMGAIPLVMISVLLASLVESFLVLPGHLRHAFEHLHRVRPQSPRGRLDRAFNHFRDRIFRPLASRAIAQRWLTLSLALAFLLLAVGLLVGGRLKFVFFPTPEAQMLVADVTFVAGTPRVRVDAFLDHLTETLRRTERELGQGPLIEVAVTVHGAKTGGGGVSASGEQLGGLKVELTPPDQRTVRNEELIAAWRERLTLPAGLEALTIIPRRMGPTGRDLTIRLTGGDATTLKAAALKLGTSLGGMPGVTEVEDDLPYGREQLVYRLTPTGAALGLTVADLGRQLRTAFAGRLVQIFQDGPDEVEVRVRLPAEDRDHLASLYRLNVQLPDGSAVPLTAVAEWRSRRGFEVLRHAQGRLAVEVTADVNSQVTSVAAVTASLQATALAALQREYPELAVSFEGRSSDQRETLGDLRTGLWVGLLLIYLVLAAVFASYGWPLVVMTAIPFGLAGALFGHWVMGLDVTLMSLFGFFALSGIVVNDSIILVDFYRGRRREGMAVEAALVDAASQRLRAVLLTSLTTIAGLGPLLLETSLQAQFLIPMACSIASGLAFTTLLVLLVVPALLSVHESIHQGLRDWWGRLGFR